MGVMEEMVVTDGGNAPPYGWHYHGPPPGDPPPDPNDGPPLPDGPPPGPPGPNPLHPDGYDEGARRYHRSTTKESYEVKLLTFPEGSQWRAWRANTIHAVVSAAGRQDDLAQEWIMKVDNEEPWALEDPGEGWISLDRKLASAIPKIARGELWPR